jgi:hypothetical protein
MKTFNKTLIAAATLTTFGLAAAPAAVALDASASVATSYLWRGLDLGNGDAALAVDLSDSMGAVSYGLWVSSGDEELGTEFDLYASYSGSVGEIGYSIGYASYIYPTDDTEFGDVEDVIYGLSYGPASYTVFDAEDSATDYEYTVVGYEAGAYSLAYGEHDGDYDNMSHLDVSYSVNDSLSLTVSTVLDSDAEANEDGTTVVASYTLPF